MGQLNFADTFNLKCREIHKEYSTKKNIQIEDYDIPDMLMHSVAELSEAYEAWRKNSMDKHLMHRRGIEVEFADCILFLMDIAGGMSLDLGGAIEEKNKFNSTRTYK